MMSDLDLFEGKRLEKAYLNLNWSISRLRKMPALGLWQI